MPIVFLVIPPNSGFDRYNDMPEVKRIEADGHKWAIAKIDDNIYFLLHKCITPTGWVSWNKIEKCPMCNQSPPNDESVAFKLLTE